MFGACSLLLTCCCTDQVMSGFVLSSNGTEMEWNISLSKAVMSFVFSKPLKDLGTPEHWNLEGTFLRPSWVEGVFHAALLHTPNLLATFTVGTYQTHRLAQRSIACNPYWRMQKLTMDKTVWLWFLYIVCMFVCLSSVALGVHRWEVLVSSINIHNY